MHLIVAAARSIPQTDNCCLACAKAIVKKFVKIEVQLTVSVNENETSSGMVYNYYATDLLTFSLIWHGFHDSIKEGDGNRIMKYWKFLLPIFQQTGHYNYSKEAFILLAQTKFLSQRKASELMWSRNVNTHGRQGCKFMQHSNRFTYGTS